MQDPQTIARQLEQTFNKIHVENMQGIPILNHNIRVEALGFQIIEGRMIGIIICPWLMNVVLLPRDDEDWSDKELGHKQPHEFSSRIYKFMINEYDGIGTCQTHSLYSPMREFSCHKQAVSAAQAFLGDLNVKRELSEEERVDEELLGKVLREEDVAINLDDFAVIEPVLVDLQPENVRPELPVKGGKKISRRNFFRGNFGW